jgi:hypothetical protein
MERRRATAEEPRPLGLEPCARLLQGTRAPAEVGQAFPVGRRSREVAGAQPLRQELELHPVPACVGVAGPRHEIGQAAALGLLTASEVGMEAPRQPAVERLQVEVRQVGLTADLAPSPRAVPSTGPRRRDLRLGARIPPGARPGTACGERSGLPGSPWRSRPLAQLLDERRSRLREPREPPRELLGQVELGERGGGRVHVAALEFGQLPRARLERPLERIHLGEQRGRSRLGSPHRRRGPGGRYVDERALPAGTHGAALSRRYFVPVPLPAAPAPAPALSARRAPSLAAESFHAA